MAKNGKIEEIRSKAEQGNDLAQFIIGISYDFGINVAQNHNEAVIWYRRAAIQGNVEAQYFLGLSYEEGEGLAHDYEEALYWYRRAADQGDADAKEAIERLIAQ